MTEPLLDRNRFRRQLLKWFDQHQRDLPWRQNRTPYRIWVSEIMLQQTQVATVVEYYLRFMDRFPDVCSLAGADEAEVLKLWEGLGYYRRARQLHAAAKVVVEQHAGEFPTRFEDVLALPGIGRYTAGAILSISLDQRLPILEGNTIRVFARLLELRDDPRASNSQKQLWAFSESLLPRKRSGDLNQALMELGSEICSPRRPQCLLCPVREHCPTGIKGLHEVIPASTKKMRYEDLHEVAIVIQRSGKFLLRQCQPGERWQGLWDFPRYQVPSDLSGGKEIKPGLLESAEMQLQDATGILARLEPTGIRIKHAVTRYRIQLDCLQASSAAGRLKSGRNLTWMSRQKIASLPMSVTGRKIADQVCLAE